jgi:hypothetical protein
MDRAAPSNEDFPKGHGTARNPPCPPFIKGGVGGDFRDGLTK